MERHPTKKTMLGIVALLLLLGIFFASEPNGDASLSASSSLNDAAEDNVSNPIAFDVDPETPAVPALADFVEKWQPKKLAPPSQPILDAIKRNTRDSKVLLTAVVNGGMLDYTLNWIKSLEKTQNADKFLVFALDKDLEDGLKQAGYGEHVVLMPSDWMHVTINPEFASWKTGDYTPITHAKSLVVERLLYLGVTVWFSDVDIVFLSEHIYDICLGKLHSRPGVEMAFSQELDGRIINSGFYIMTPTLTTKRIIDHTIAIQDAEIKKGTTQQAAMNTALETVSGRFKDSPYVMLDMLLFPQGRDFFEKNVPRKYGLEPMIVHANFMAGQKKREAFENAGLWYV